MSTSKHFEKIAWFAVLLCFVLTLLFMNGEALGITASAREMGYESRLFDTARVHKIDIVMDDWDAFLSTATSEEYTVAALVIDGEAYKNVGIRGKGNTSLSTVASMDSNRYSFKVEFDRYDSTKTYYGLDKLCLNNLIQDNTMMKDYLTYRMMAEFGVAAPLCSFVYLTVNGEDWGLYLAVEGVEESFLQRNYGKNYGELYKPDSMSMGGGRGNGKEFDMNDFFGNETQTETSTTENFDFGNRNNATVPNMENFNFGSVGGATAPDMENFDFSQMDFSGKGGGMMGGFGMGSSYVKLQYIDDEFSSYSNIWNNAKTDISEADQRRLITSLQTLSTGDSSAVDTDAVLRYFTVHNFVCNGDSYTGSMIHNYYLYEKDGVLSMIPWDYNLGFGTFQGGNATSTVNEAIDTALSDRPMVNWIFTDETYTQQYHQYMSVFLGTVDMNALIDEAYGLIAPYVAKDPTKFCTVEEFETGVSTLKEFCALRSDSVKQQLANNDTSSSTAYINADHLNLSDMGSMGGGMGGGMGGRGDFTPSGDTENRIPQAQQTSFSGDKSQTAFSNFSFSPTANGTVSDMGTVPDMGQMPDMGDMSQFPDMGDMNQMPNMGDMSQFPDMGNMPQMPSDGTVPETQTPSDSTGTETQAPSDGTTSSSQERPSGGSFDRGNMPDMGNMGNMSQASQNTNTNWIWLGVSILILLIGLLLAKVLY